MRPRFIDVAIGNDEHWRMPLFVFLLLALSAAGCASTTGQRDAIGNPQIERLAPQEIARLGPARPGQLTAEDLVRMTQEGATREQILDRYHRSGSRLKLSEAQIADLRRRGVDQRVLDDIVQAERNAERTDAITAQADREAAERMQREHWREYRYYDPWRDPYPYYWGPRAYPYFGYGGSRWSSGWYGGLGVWF